MLSCKLFDAAEFTENNTQISAALAYAKEHAGLTMSRRYLHQVVKHDGIATIQDAIINTNELIQKINTWWNSSTNENPISAQIFSQDQLLRQLKTVDILNSTPIPKPSFTKNFVKYYPGNCISIENHPTRFLLTSIGKKLLKTHLKMSKIYNKYKTLSKTDPLAIELKIQLNTHGFQVKELNHVLDLDSFKPGPTQYILASDLPISHLNLPCFWWKNVVDMKDYKCLSAFGVLDQNANLTQDSVSTLLWANEKKSQKPSFWKRYNLEIKKWIKLQNFDSPKWSSTCEKSTFSGLKCLQPMLGTVGRCGSYCESHFEESLYTLINVLKSVYIIHSQEEIPLFFQGGYLSCSSFNFNSANVTEIKEFIEDYPWPQVLKLTFCGTHENQILPKKIQVVWKFWNLILLIYRN
jgi:hypothetical protein